MPTSAIGSDTTSTADDVAIDEALRHADALAADGRAREAVELLTALNREVHDGTIEHRLVALRHQAFLQLTPEPGRASWPPTVDDVFAGCTGVPEVQADELTAEAVASGILHHGALWVRGLVSPETARTMSAEIDRAFDSYGQAQDDHVDQALPYYAKFEPLAPYNVGAARNWVWQGGGVWTVDSPRLLFELTELAERSGLGAVLTSYLGERPALSVKKCTLRRVPAETGTDWHQDGSFLGDTIRTVNLWLTLSPCGVDAPGLDLVPKRFDHIVETGTNGAQFDWSVGPGTVDQVATDAPVVRPQFDAGDALLFDEKFLHRTGVSPDMTKSRHAIESWFFAPSHYPHDQVPILF